MALNVSEKGRQRVNRRPAVPRLDLERLHEAAPSAWQVEDFCRERLRRVEQEIRELQSAQQFFEHEEQIHTLEQRAERIKQKLFVLAKPSCPIHAVCRPRLESGSPVARTGSGSSTNSASSGGGGATTAFHGTDRVCQLPRFQATQARESCHDSSEPLSPLAKRKRLLQRYQRHLDVLDGGSDPQSGPTIGSAAWRSIPDFESASEGVSDSDSLSYASPTCHGGRSKQPASDCREDKSDKSGLWNRRFVVSSTCSRTRQAPDDGMRNSSPTSHSQDPPAPHTSPWTSTLGFRSLLPGRVLRYLKTGCRALGFFQGEKCNADALEKAFEECTRQGTASQPPHDGHRVAWKRPGDT